MRVLLRAWPMRGGDIGLEHVVEIETCFEDKGDAFYIQELGTSVDVLRRLNVPEDGHDAELHFELPQALYVRLKPLWRHMSDCTACPKRATA